MDIQGVQRTATEIREREQEIAVELHRAAGEVFAPFILKAWELVEKATHEQTI